MSTNHGRTTDSPGRDEPVSGATVVAAVPRGAGRIGAEEVESVNAVLTEAPAEVASGEDNLDEAVAIFLGTRRRLLAIAYRILGSTSEAEDLVQEIWLRWQRTDRTVVANPQAFLATMTTRLAINVSQSARRRHETSVGPWFPEPVSGGDDDPAAGAEQGEEVERAVLILLGRLPPRQRAAYVLREAFDYPYGRISEILHLGAANTRQLVSRAHGRIASDGPATVTPGAHRQLLRAFRTAARTGNLAELEELLAADCLTMGPSAA